MQDSYVGGQWLRPCLAQLLSRLSLTPDTLLITIGVAHPAPVGSFENAIELGTPAAGINTAIYSPSGANSGVGFAIPVDIVRSSVDQIIRFGRVIRPILGISFAPDQSSEQVSVSSLHASCAVCAYEPTESLLQRL